MYIIAHSVECFKSFSQFIAISSNNIFRMQESNKKSFLLPRSNISHIFAIISNIIGVQIPSSASLPSSLLSKETQKVRCHFTASKAKNRGWNSHYDCSNPCFELILLYFGLFYPPKAWKSLSCLGRQKRFLSWCEGWDLNPHVESGH